MSGAADNPLAEILNLIPWELRVLDLEFVDKLSAIVHSYPPREWYTNNYFILLMIHLAEAGLIQMSVVPEPENGPKGVVYLIKRI